MLIPWRRARVATKEDVPQIPREIWVLVIGAFIIALGFGLIAPVLPQYARSFDVSVFAASFVVSSFSILRLIFAPTSGKLVDKFGGRRTYLIGLLIVAGSTLLVAAAQNYWQLLFFRAAGGIGSTMFTVAAMGLIVRIAPPEIRGRCSAAYGSAFLLGNVFGPLLGAAMAPLGMRVPFVVYGVALVIATAVVWRMLQSDAGTAGAKNAGLPVLTFREALTDSAYRASLVSGFANGWSNFGVRVAIVPLFAAAAFTNGAAVAGLALTFFAAGNVVALQFSGRLADSIGRKPILVIGLIINGIFTAVLGFMHGDIAVMAVSAIAGFGAGMINPAQQATVSDIVGNERQGGKVFASYQMAQDLGAISGPLIVGLIVDLVGYEAGFISCGLITAVALVAWLFGRETWEGKRVKPEALEDSK